MLVGALAIFTAMTGLIWLGRKGWKLDNAKYTRLEMSPEL